MTTTITSKLPATGTTIFSVMSALAQEHQAINLSQGFPNFDSGPRLKALVQKHMEAGRNQYAPMPGVPLLRQRITEKVQRLYHKDLNPDTEVTVTAGATQALFTAITAFVRPGDEVIVIEPAYDCYAPAVQLQGGKVLPCPLQFPGYSIDWNLLESQLSPNTRMLIINTPHNPTGTLLQEADLHRLEQLLAPTDTILLSDEVYEHLIYDGGKHTSILNHPGLWDRGLATYSFGKTFHNTGWKMGYCLAPAHLMQEFRKVHQFNVFSVNTPVQYALADYLADPNTYEQLPGFYQEKRDLFTQILEQTPFRPLPCQGTYFQLADYSDISEEDELTFARHLTEVYGVAAIPVSAFYHDQRSDRVLRFCFAKTADVLEQAGEKLHKVGR